MTQPVLLWSFRAALLWLVLLPAAVHAAEGPRLADVQLGLAGAFKLGCWTPVTVRVTAGDQPLEARLDWLAPDGDGLQICYTEDQPASNVRLAPHESATVTRYIKLGRVRGQLEAQLRAGDRLLAQHSSLLSQLARPLTADQYWIVTAGSVLDLDNVLRRRRVSSSSSPHAAHLAHIESLPTRWFGYEGVDVLVLTTSDPQAIERCTQEQFQAIERWVQLGGTLVVSSGKNAERLAAAAGPLARFVPGQIVASLRPRAAPGLETLARAEQPLAVFDAAAIEEVDGIVVSFIEGRTEGTRPAIVRAARGFGQVWLLAFDVDQAPFSEWPATGELLRTVLLPSHLQREGSYLADASRRVTHYGYDEMVGQLRGALDHFPAGEGTPGVKLISFFVVAGLLVIYLVLVSAGDYFLLRRYFGQMAWTWVTFPVIVLLFCLAIYALGRYWRGPPRVRLNQVDLVDVDVQSGAMRGATWAHLYSPATRAYDLSLEAHLPVAAGQGGGAEADTTDSGASSSGSSLSDASQNGASPNGSSHADASPSGALLSWQGLPGRGLGGFQTTAADLMFGSTYIVRSDGAPPPSLYMQDVPVPVGSTRSLLGQWWHFQPLAPPLELTAGRDGVLHGNVKNVLNVTLEDALLAYDRWAYRIDRPLAPGEVLRVDGLVRRDLEWRLTRRRLQQSQTTYTVTPWEPQSRDVERILEIMMLHQAAGGVTYTQLAHNYQDFTDLSDHLKLGRAVLIGRVEQPATTLRNAEQSLTEQADRRWSWCRLILPVEITAAADR